MLCNRFNCLTKQQSLLFLGEEEEIELLSFSCVLLTFYAVKDFFAVMCLYVSEREIESVCVCVLVW